MNKKVKYLVKIDDVDIEYILEVYDRLVKKFDKDTAKFILSQSSLLPRLNEDAQHVHHKDPEYWVDLSINQYNSNKSKNDINTLAR